MFKLWSDFDHVILLLILIISHVLQNYMASNHLDHIVFIKIILFCIAHVDTVLK